MAKIVFLLVLVTVIAVLEVQGLSSSQCPLSSKMTECSPKCKDDTECHGRICCPNICNSKSCTYPDRQNTDNKYKSSSSGATGNYCGHHKCNSYEKCEQDRATKQMKCVRT